jgi:hypothetical protein
MNKEQIIDEAYENYLHYTILGVTNGLDRITGHLDNCLVEYEGYYEHFTNPSFAYGFRPHTVEEFINKCKTDSKFSEKWGLKIEERELSLFEKTTLYCIKMGYHSWKERVLGTIEINGEEYLEKEFTKHNIPTKLITLTYNNETIESYE